MPRPPSTSPDDRAAYALSTRPIASGSMKKGKPCAWVRFPPTLFAQVRAEAVLRKISFSAVVVELCEASIEGIE